MCQTPSMLTQHAVFYHFYVQQVKMAFFKLTYVSMNQV